MRVQGFSAATRTRALALGIALLGVGTAAPIASTAGERTHCSSGFCITSVPLDDGIREIRAHHGFAVSTQVKLRLELDRMRAVPAEERLALVQPGETLTLARVIPTTAGGSYRYHYSFQTGDPQAVHDDSARYVIPFGGRAPRMLTQRGNGGFSHRGRIAYDFRMPVGTPILAAREGVVAFVVDEYEKGGRRRSLAGKANRIGIAHPDGTISLYVHLRKGAVVETGQHVVAGQHIGYSGNTGYTTGPHLHFEVYRALPATEAGIESETIEILFEDTTGKGTTPVARSYYGPGKAVAVVAGEAESSN